MSRDTILNIEKAARGYIVSGDRYAERYPIPYAFSTLDEALDFLRTYFLDKEAEKPNNE